MPTDSIYLEGLRVDTIIGVYEYEKKITQPLMIDCELQLDLTAAGLNDHVDKTIDYAAVAALITKTITAKPIELLECVAMTVLRALFDNTPANTINLKVSKGGIVPNCQNVAVRFTRQRQQMNL